MNNAQYQTCKIIQDRLDDALQDLHDLEAGHPDEGRRIAYSKSLKDLKMDLKRNGLWVII